MFRYVLGIIVVLFALTKILDNSVFLNNVFGSVFGNIYEGYESGYMNTKSWGPDQSIETPNEKMIADIKKTLGGSDWIVLKGFSIAGDKPIFMKTTKAAPNGVIGTKIVKSYQKFDPEINKKKGQTTDWRYQQSGKSKYKSRIVANKIKTEADEDVTSSYKTSVVAIESWKWTDINNGYKKDNKWPAGQLASFYRPIDDTKIKTIVPKSNGLVFIKKASLTKVYILKDSLKANKIVENKTEDYDVVLTSWLHSLAPTGKQVQYSPFDDKGNVNIVTKGLLAKVNTAILTKIDTPSEITTQLKLNAKIKTSYTFKCKSKVGNIVIKWNKANQSFDITNTCTAATSFTAKIDITTLSQKVQTFISKTPVQIAITTFIKKLITTPSVQKVTYSATEIIITSDGTINAASIAHIISEINKNAALTIAGSIGAVITAAEAAAATAPVSQIITFTDAAVLKALKIPAARTKLITFIKTYMTNKKKQVTVSYDAATPTKVTVSSVKPQILAATITSLKSAIVAGAKSTVAGSIGAAIVAAEAAAATAATAATAAAGGAAKQATPAITKLDIQLGLATKATATAAAAGGFLDAKTAVALPAAVTKAKAAKVALVAMVARKPAVAATQIVAAIKAVTDQTAAIEKLLADEAVAATNGFVRSFADSITVDGPNPKTKLAIKLASTAANTALKAAFDTATGNAFAAPAATKYSTIFGKPITLKLVKTVYNAGGNINYNYKVDFKPAIKVTAALKATLKTQITTNIKTAIRTAIMEPHGAITKPSPLAARTSGGEIYQKLFALVGVSLSSLGVITSLNEAYIAVNKGYPAVAANKVTSVKNAIIKVNKNSINSKVIASFKTLKPPILTQVKMTNPGPTADLIIKPTLKCVLLMDSAADKATVEQLKIQLQTGLSKYFIAQIIAQSKQGGTIAAAMAAYKSVASGSIVDSSATGPDGKPTTEIDLSAYVLKSSIPPCAAGAAVESPFATDEFYSNFESCYQSYRPVGLGNQKDFLECLGFDDAYKATKPAVPFVSSATAQKLKKKPDNVFEDIGDFVKDNLVYIVIGGSVVISAIIVADKYKGKGNVSVEDI